MDDLCDIVASKAPLISENNNNLKSATKNGKNSNALPVQQLPRGDQCLTKRASHYQSSTQLDMLKNDDIYGNFDNERRVSATFVPPSALETIELRVS
ncbi:unnamed protein product [Ceratitis capitata]|uniref:(Mediterranean fruit fly) hypothetical protein n=1 Tax=Ceratitis capitata TaxID=7213 RepID=A0A811UQD7_CERCA|nr:unnamed protein product [Ceratitis capitata]